MRKVILAALMLGSAMPAGAVILVEERGLSDYVQGRHASATGELNRAAELFEEALDYAPSEPHLLKITFELAIGSGDEELAIDAARRLVIDANSDSGLHMLLAADALKRRKWDLLSSHLAALESTGFGALAAPIVKAWALAARGKSKAARERLAGEAPDGFARTYWAEHRGHLALASGREAEAIADYRTLIAEDEGRNSRIRIALAEALQEQGDDDEALLVLDAARPHPDVTEAKARLTAGKNIAFAPDDARAGMATLLLRIAADLSQDRTVPIALTFARISTWLNPDDANGWLMVSQFLARGEQYDSALAAARQVGVDDPASGLARGQEAALLSAMEREDEALMMLQAAAASSTPTAEDLVRLGDAYQADERFAEAIAAYRQSLALETESNEVRWQTWFLIGAAEEQNGDWQAAEIALRKALELSPEQAITLNYLGYTLLDRGMKQDEAIRLIEEAHRLEPNDGHITDSLGWAEYKLGQYEKAVKTLEMAIADVPDDATINDHLGDAYWKVGRKIEARFRWQAALLGEPDEAQIAAINAKLNYGYERGIAMADADAPARP